MISDLRFDAVQLFKNNPIKLAKVLSASGTTSAIRYFETVLGLSPIKNRTFARLFAKTKPTDCSSKQLKITGRI